MAQLICKNLNIGYSEKIILENLNFEVNSGDYIAVIGENGAGKSTLIKTILGLQPRMGGIIMTGEGLKQSEIGYLPQQTLIQKDFPASVREIVISGCQGRCGIRPFYNKNEKQIANDAMEKMNVKLFSKRCYRELSGGQQQKVLLARALCATRKMLLLDEPVTGLDPKTTIEMYELIEKINRIDGISIIMISHDVEKVVKYASHILHMGDSVFFGTKKEYLCTVQGRGLLKEKDGDIK